MIMIIMIGAAARLSRPLRDPAPDRGRGPPDHTDDNNISIIVILVILFKLPLIILV